MTFYWGGVDALKTDTHLSLSSREGFLNSQSLGLVASFGLVHQIDPPAPGGFCILKGLVTFGCVNCLEAPVFFFVRENKELVETKREKQREKTNKTRRISS